MCVVYSLIFWRLWMLLFDDRRHPPGWVWDNSLEFRPALLRFILRYQLSLAPETIRIFATFITALFYKQRLRQFQNFSAWLSEIIPTVDSCSLLTVPVIFLHRSSVNVQECPASPLRRQAQVRIIPKELPSSATQQRRVYRYHSADGWSWRLLTELQQRATTTHDDVATDLSHKLFERWLCSDSAPSER